MSANAGSSSGRPQDELHGFQLEDVPTIDLREVVEPPQDIPPSEAPLAPAGRAKPGRAPAATSGSAAAFVHTPPWASAAQAFPTQEALAREPVARKPDAPDGGGWLVPFLAGALVGAGGFYAVLWLLALI